MTTEPPKYGVMMTTVATKEDAARLAETLLRAALAACVQIVPIESYYTWKTGLAHENEHLLLIKTKTALFDDAMRAVEDAHPYETPEIVCTEFSAGSAEYFAWVDSVTK